MPKLSVFILASSRVLIHFCLTERVNKSRQKYQGVPYSDRTPLTVVNGEMPYLTAVLQVERKRIDHLHCKW